MCDRRSDGQTDGRTDRQRDGIVVASTALAMRALRRAVKSHRQRQNRTLCSSLRAVTTKGKKKWGARKMLEEIPAEQWFRKCTIEF